jgi:hypothetical protein
VSGADLSEEKPMGKFRYTGDESRIYGDLSLEVNPGDIVELDGDPPADGRWTAVTAKTKSTEKE